ncbi:uncharacterized protein LOC141700527 [Apium graveolens]|uniref:uncharacterized protein LOC141700527 n=1 Tax=Apium graveolens TaxID=4045 RepID=UPI003D7B7D2A
MAWDEIYVQSLGMASYRNWRWVQFKIQSSNIIFRVINVYGPLSMHGKRQLWKELSDIIILINNEMVCLVGDFNSIKSSNESANCSYRRMDVQGFASFIKSNNLCDVGLINDSFTWFGPQGKCNRLDRFLLNDLWFSEGLWEVKALHRLLSDHKPLVLYIKKCKGGPVPFKAFNWWLEDERIRDDMNKYWSQSQKIVSGDKFQVMLKKFKFGLKKWSLGTKDNLDLEIESLKSKIDYFDSNHIFGSEVVDYNTKLTLCLKARDSMLRQKARALWCVEGDRNSKFFHKVIQ